MNLYPHLQHPGKVARHAAYHRAAGHLEIAEAYEAQLNAMGRCRICGRQLTDAASLARGIGPMCDTKAQIPPWTDGLDAAVERHPAGGDTA